LNPAITDGPTPEDLTACASIDLLALARSGNRVALEVLFERYLKPLRQWASGRLPRWARDLADTQDLVQDALLQTFKRIELFEPEYAGALQAYLRQAVMNRIRDEFRARRRRRVAETIDENLPAGEPSPLDEAIAADVAADYEDALTRLRPEERDAIIGRIEMNLTYDELAVTLNRPNANAARSAVVRAIVRLSEEMGRG
jgi:RNA polymerase sigma factor (sigma-70 family)